MTLFGWAGSMAALGLATAFKAVKETAAAKR
jgi:hypothetical protein